MPKKKLKNAPSISAKNLSLEKQGAKMTHHLHKTVNHIRKRGSRLYGSNMRLTPKQTLPQNKKQTHHHDIFFKNIYSKPAFALELFKLIFNKEEFSACDWKHLKTEEDTLKEKRADLIFSVPLKAKPKTQIKIFILLEHKSYKDPEVFSQFLYYQTLLYEKSLKTGESFLIIPVLFYHGKTPWKGSKIFQEDLFKGFFSKIPAGFRKNMINYEIRLLEASRLKGVFKNKSFKSRGALYLLKKIWELKLTHSEMKDVLSKFGEFEDKSKVIVSVADYLHSFFKMSKKFKRVWQKAEKELVEEGIFKRGGYMDAIKHIEERGRMKGLQKGLRKGRQEGMQKGIQKGMQKGRQELILKMLNKKLDIKLVSEVTGLSPKEIKKLKNGS